MLLTSWLRSLVFVPLLWVLAGCAGEPVVRTPPPLPPPVVEAVPAQLDPANMWVPGEWAWRQRVNAYVWVPGRWDTPVSPGAVWVPGHWAAGNGSYVWVEGGWKPR